MLAAAAGSVTILVLSSVVRCSLGIAGDRQEAAAEATASAAAAVPAETNGDAAETPPQDELRAKSWRSGQASVEFKGGLFVETEGDTTKATAFDVVSDSSQGAQRVLTIDAYGTDSVTRTVVVVEGEGTGETVRSDAFKISKSYAVAPEGDRNLAIEGVDADYLSLVGGDEAPLEEAVADFCSSAVPTATVASFDGEVYLDTKAGTVSATFTCNDAARTIVSVTCSAGSFSVSG